MKSFHCAHCQRLLFFENSQCVSCGSRLAYVPDAAVIDSLPAEAGDTWTSINPALSGRRFRLCRNYVEHQTCNWAVDADSGDQLCRSCRLTRVIPDLTGVEARVAWYRLEVAKRRLVFTLLALGLPLRDRGDDPRGGLAFEFKADSPGGDERRVMTGHVGGVITLNVAEADDAERERRRQGLGEAYRTLLGHMRHESGHYYWERLLHNTPELQGYRQLFGDERHDYGAALQQHYAVGAPGDWRDRYVSAYASAHPWEDWAETWAHYLHMVDALDTAAESGVILRPPRADERRLPGSRPTVAAGVAAFDRLIDRWFSLTYVLNNLNRSLGLADGYPFVLSGAAVEKLRFVHKVVSRASSGAKTAG